MRDAEDADQCALHHVDTVPADCAFHRALLQISDDEPRASRSLSRPPVRARPRASSGLPIGDLARRPAPGRSTHAYTETFAGRRSCDLPGLIQGGADTSVYRIETKYRTRTRKAQTDDDRDERGGDGGRDRPRRRANRAGWLLGAYLQGRVADRDRRHRRPRPGGVAGARGSARRRPPGADPEAVQAGLGAVPQGRANRGGGGRSQGRRRAFRPDRGARARSRAASRCSRWLVRSTTRASRCSAGARTSPGPRRTRSRASASRACACSKRRRTRPDCRS